jgi:hypothetical protein
METSRRRLFAFGAAGAALAVTGTAASFGLKEVLDIRSERNQLRSEKRLMEGQFGFEAYEEDPSLTKYFAELAIEHAPLNLARKSMGVIRLNEIQGVDGRNRGSALLVDRFGIILTSYHQIKEAHDIEIQFFPEKGKVCTARAMRTFHEYPEHDIAFLKINPSFIVAHGLAPIKFATPKDIKQTATKKFYSVGFPTLINPPRLHATSCYLSRSKQADDFMKSCKVKVDGAVFRGHSGGMAFLDNKCFGLFLGSNLINAGNIASGHFSSVYAMQADYIDAFPDEAKKMGLPNFNIEEMSPGCSADVGRRVRHPIKYDWSINEPFSVR